MSIGAVNLGLGLGPQLETQGNKGAALSGQLQGMSVQVEQDPLSALNDSAEEMTFARDNSKQTKLADRKQRQGLARQEELIARIKKLQETVNGADNEAKNQVLLKFKAQGQKDSVKLWQDLAHLGSHPSSDYAFLLNAADKSVAPEEKALLLQAAEQLFAAHQAEIQAVLNSLPALKDESFAGALQISQAYSTICSGSHDPKDLLDYISKTFGADQVHSGIEALFKALGSDLNSLAPSHDSAVLNDIAGALSQTKTLNAALTLLDQFVSRVNHVLKLPCRNVKSDELLQRLITLAQSRFVAPLQIHNIYRKEIVTHNPEEDVLLAQEFFKKLRDLPVELFDSLDSRAKVIDATQHLVDELIDKEDAWLEGEGS